MTDGFLWQAFIAGVGIALVSGPLGCFVVWKKLAYFGDSLSHASVLGITLGLILGLNISLAVAGFSLLFACIIVWMTENPKISTDTYLGVLSHTAFSLGALLISYIGNSIDIHAYLFGDILLVSSEEIFYIYLVAAGVLTALTICYRPLLRITVDEGIATAEGVNVRIYKILLMVMLAITISVSVRIVGVLMITAFLIIPSSAARFSAKSPLQMMVYSTGFTIAALALGLELSYRLDMTSGAMIILMSSAVFFTALILFGKK